MIWLQRDPLGQLAGPDEYAYVMGEPRDYYDPMGLAADTFDGLDLDGNANGVKRKNRNTPTKKGDSNHNGGWTDEQDRAMYDEARRNDKGFEAAGEIADAGTSLVPIKGEIDDLRVLYADDSSTWQRIGAGASLAVNFLTAGLLPNFGSGVKAAEAVDAANDLTQGGRAADKANEASKSAEAVNAAENAKTAANARKAPTKGEGCPERPKRVTNKKHHPKSDSPEPKNVEELYERSIADEKGRRWAMDDDGTIHRFSPPSNGETHWNGSGFDRSELDKEVYRELVRQWKSRK